MEIALESDMSTLVTQPSAWTKAAPHHNRCKRWHYPKGIAIAFGMMSRIAFLFTSV